MARARSDAVGLVVTLACIAAVTLFPGAMRDASRIDLCLVCGINGGATALLNVVLFVPLGFFVRRVGPVRHAILAGFAVSFAIELAQLFIPGRETALSDLLANTAGAWVGAMLALRPAAWLVPTGLASRIASTFLATLFAAMVAASGPLLEPSAPRDAYYAQWTPNGRHHEQYRGRVVSAALDGTALPPQRLADSTRMDRRLFGGDELVLRFVASAPTRSLEPVLRIVAGPFGESDDVLVIGAEGADLIVWARTRADDLRLSRPTLGLAGALRDVEAGDTVELRLRRVTGEGFSATVDDQPRRPLTFSVARGWSLLLAAPVRSAVWLTVLDHLWFLSAALIIGWYAVQRSLAAIAFALVTTAAFWAPTVSDLARTPFSLPAAFAAGLALGMIARRGVARSRGFSAWTASRPPGGVRSGTATTPPRWRRSR